MQLSSLALYATSTDVEIDRAQLVGFLASRKLIGQPIREALLPVSEELLAEEGLLGGEGLSANEGVSMSESFLAGEDFFKAISFLGCSPAIALRPEDGPQFMRITVGVSAVPILFTHQRARPPLCMACKTPMHDWKGTIRRSSENSIECEHCQQVNAIEQLHFRKRACFTRTVIRIQPVFESEAIPDSSLLFALADIFNVEFRYAYI